LDERGIRPSGKAKPAKLYSRLGELNDAHDVAHAAGKREGRRMLRAGIVRGVDGGLRFVICVGNGGGVTGMIGPIVPGRGLCRVRGAFRGKRGRGSREGESRALRRDQQRDQGDAKKAAACHAAC
jgi:hypothetical protein